MKNAIARFAALAAITTAACGNDASINAPSTTADAQNVADAGRLGDLSSDTHQDIVSELSRSPDSEGDAPLDTKQCGTLKVKPNMKDYPVTTCLSLDQNNTIIPQATMQIIGEVVNPMSVEFATATTSAKLGIACNKDATTVKAATGLAPVTVFSIKEGDAFTIETQAGKDCEVNTTHYKFTEDLSGQSFEQDGSVSKPYPIGYCDGKGFEAIAPGISCSNE